MFQDRFLALLIAGGAKPMLWLALVHTWLKCVSERPLPRVLQFIALHLTFPVFEAHNLMFKASYALGSIRLRRVCRRQRLLGFENVLSERELDFIDRRALGDSIEALHNVKCRLEALIGPHNFCATYQSRLH